MTEAIQYITYQYGHQITALVAVAGVAILSECVRRWVETIGKAVRK